MQWNNSISSFFPFSYLFFFWIGPNRSKLQDMLANLRDVDELPSLQPSVGSPSRPSSSRLPEHEINRADEGKYFTSLVPQQARDGQPSVKSSERTPIFENLILQLFDPHNFPTCKFNFNFSLQSKGRAILLTLRLRNI